MLSNVWCFKEVGSPNLKIIMNKIEGEEKDEYKNVNN